MSTLTTLNLNPIKSRPGVVTAKNSNSNKADMCHWRDSGVCRFGSKCQIFKHTKVPVDQVHHHMAGKAVQLTKSSLPPPQQPSLLSTLPTPMTSSTSSLQIKPNSGSINGNKHQNPALLCYNCSPVDDGIEVILPLGLSERKKNPSKQDFEAEVPKALYGTGSTKRLLVFLNIGTDLVPDWFLFCLKKY